jgi:hypothetical protein
MLLKSRASPDMLPFSLCNKKILAIRHIEQTPLSNDTIDSVLRHREVGRAKDLSAPPRRGGWTIWRRDTFLARYGLERDSSDVDSVATQLKLKALATMNGQVREMLDIIHNI